jgi:hypothetical protein
VQLGPLELVQRSVVGREVFEKLPVCVLPIVLKLDMLVVVMCPVGNPVIDAELSLLPL